MREGWELVKLGEVCLFENGDRGKNYPSRSEYVEDGIPFVNAGHLSENKIDLNGMNFISEKNFNLLSRGKFSEGDILYCLRGSLGKFGKVQEGLNGAIASSLVIVRPKQKILSDYLVYYFITDISQTMIKKFAGGAAQPNLGAKDLKKFQIPIPPLPEQKRIVAILDEAFEAIDQAKANVERNIENAEELFQSKLNEIFSQRGESWVSEKLSNVFKMKSGDQLSKKNVIPGPYPVYGGNGITAHHKDYNLEGQQILIGRVGAQCGNVHLTDEKIWLTDNAFKVTDLKFDFDFEFLELLLRVKDLRQTARQTAQPVISNSSCKNVQLDFPESITQQKEMAELVNSLDSEVLQIIEAFKTKLSALEELKKSILQKAFSGELTENEHMAV